MEKFNFYWITWCYLYLTRVNRFEGSLRLSSRCRKMEWIRADGKVQFILNHLVVFVLDKSKQICREFWLSCRCRKMEWIRADGKVQFILNHLAEFILDKSKQIWREFLIIMQMPKKGMNTSRLKRSIFINGSLYLTSINRFEGSFWLSCRCQKMEWIWADWKVQFLLMVVHTWQA